MYPFRSYHRGSDGFIRKHHRRQNIIWLLETFDPIFLAAPKPGTKIGRLAGLIAAEKADS